MKFLTIFQFILFLQQANFPQAQIDSHFTVWKLCSTSQQNVIQPKPSCPLKASLSWWLEDFQKSNANQHNSSLYM